MKTYGIFRFSSRGGGVMGRRLVVGDIRLGALARLGVPALVDVFQFHESLNSEIVLLVVC